ncbi:MAG: sugar phosphate isomerase/epimerase family protein [Terriglobia bacterium]|jgi:sugar phosphate isomerase/epimerase
MYIENQANSSRREFLRTVAAASAAASLSAHRAPASPAEKPRVQTCYFSKHLQWLGWEQMAETTAELGFDGIDLTVREGGHVLPARVKEDLPKVATIVRKAGLDIPMITAGIEDIHSPHAEDILRAASEVGIPRYRWGWFSWSDTEQLPDLSRFRASPGKHPELLIDVPRRLSELKKRVAELADLNQKYNVCAMYHNHSGPLVGASVWDLWVLLKDFDSRWVSSNFDVGHATVEGGLGGWVNSTRLMAPFMRGTAIKDFKWGKNRKGEWEPLWCPLGEGMVNFPAFLAMLKEADFAGPVQLHSEYPLGGAENGDKTLTLPKSTVLATIRKDLITLKGWMKEAQLV